MDEAAIMAHIMATFDDVHVAEADGSYFFFDSEAKKFPFCHAGDFRQLRRFSNLGRLGVFRLNLGLSRRTFGELFPANPDALGLEPPVPDYTVLDELMPHPVYAGMHWVCVLNPSAATFEKVGRCWRKRMLRPVEKRSKRGRFRCLRGG